MVTLTWHRVELHTWFNLHHPCKQVQNKAMHYGMLITEP